MFLCAKFDDIPSHAVSFAKCLFREHYQKSKDWSSSNDWRKVPDPEIQVPFDLVKFIWAVSIAQSKVSLFVLLLDAKILVSVSKIRGEHLNVYFMLTYKAVVLEWDRAFSTSVRASTSSRDPAQKQPTPIGDHPLAGEGGKMEMELTRVLMEAREDGAKNIAERVLARMGSLSLEDSSSEPQNGLWEEEEVTEPEKAMDSGLSSTSSTAEVNDAVFQEELDISRRKCSSAPCGAGSKKRPRKKNRWPSAPCRQTRCPNKVSLDRGASAETSDKKAPQTKRKTV